MPRMPVLLRHSDSLDSHWEDAVYSYARFVAADHKAQAAATAKTIKQIEELQGGQRAAWRREIVAQATVDAVDDTLDDQVEGLSRELLHIEAGNRKSARYKQYFKNAVSTIVRLGLESQLPVVRTITAMLSQEPEKELKERAKSLNATLKKGDEAVTERREAAAARAAHRAREILKLVDDFNAQRTSQHAELTLEATKAKLPRDYADRFFRRSSKARPAAPPEPEPTG